MTDADKDKLSINERLDVYELRHRATANPEPIVLQLYQGAQRENNDQTLCEITTKHNRERHLILDSLGIPNMRSQCTFEELAKIDDPNKKLRNASLSGSYLGMLDELTVRQRGELAVRFHGQYMLFTNQPNKGTKEHEFWIGDVTVVCDNLRVPRYLNECNEDERVFLEIKMSDREMDEAYPDGLWSRRMMYGNDLNRTMERFRELMSKYPLQVTLPSIGPRDHLNDMDPWPLRDYQSDPAKMPLPTDYIFDVGRKHLEDGPQAFQRLKDRVASGGFRRDEFILDPAFVIPRTERKTWCAEQMWYDTHFRLQGPPIHLDDSPQMFAVKMSNRERDGRTPGYYAVHQAYMNLPDIDGVVRILPHDTYTIDSVALYGRQTGKKRLQQTMFWANHTDWGTAQWLRSQQLGFYLHASHPRVDDVKTTDRFYYTVPDIVGEYSDLAREHLFPNFKREIDYGRTSRTPRRSSRRK